MTKSNESDRIIALQIANDILKRYGDFVQLEPEEYTQHALQLAEIFLEWAANDGKMQMDALSDFFNH